MHIRVLALVACCTALLSCSDDKKSSGSDEKDVYEAKLFSTTHELTATALASMTPDPGNGVLVFAGNDPAVSGLKTGEVILAGISPATPVGLIRFVKTVEVGSASVTVTTVNAPIQAAFQKLHVVAHERSFDITDDDAVVTPLAAFGPQKRIQAVRSATDNFEAKIPLNFPLYDGDKDPTTTDDQVYVKGSLGGSYSYLLGFDTDWGIVDSLPGDIATCAFSGFSDCEISDLLPSASAGFEVHARTDATVALEGAPFLKFQKPYPIASVKLDAFAIGPLVFVPEVRISALIEGKASSKFKVSAGAHAGVDGGVSFSTDKGAYNQSPTPFFTYDDPTADVALSAEGKASIEARLRIALYEIMGPYAALSTYAKVTANQDASPCWSVDTGLDGRFGFDIGLDLGKFGYKSLADAKVPFNIVNATVATGSCGLPAGSSALPIGAGPDAEHLQNPTFAPYALQIPPTAVTSSDNGQTPWEGSRVYAHEGQERPYATRAIDGSFVVGFGDSTGLAKVRENGTTVWGSRYEFADRGINNQYVDIAGIGSNGDTTIAVATETYGLMYLDQDGNVLSARTYDIPRNTSDGIHGNDDGRSFRAIVADDDNGLYVSATQTDTSDGIPRLWLMRLDVAGNPIWSKRFGSGATDGVFPTLLLKRPDGGVTVAGYLYNPSVGGTAVAFNLEIAADGSTLQSRRHAVACGGATPYFFPLGGVRTIAGDLVLTGDVNYANAAVKINSAGTATNAVGRKQTSSPTSFYLSAIDELPTGGFIASGYASERLLVAILDSGLTPTSFSTTLFKNFNVSVSEILATDDGGGIIHAATTQKGSSEPPLFTAKLPAKSMAISYSGPQVEAVTELSIQPVSCTLSSNAWDPTPADYAPPAHSTTVRRDTFSFQTVTLNQ